MKNPSNSSEYNRYIAKNDFYNIRRLSVKKEYGAIEKRDPLLQLLWTFHMHGILITRHNDCHAYPSDGCMKIIHTCITILNFLFGIISPCIEYSSCTTNAP